MTARSGSSTITHFCEPNMYFGFYSDCHPWKGWISLHNSELQLKYKTQKMVERSFLVSLESGSLWPCWSCSIGAAGTHTTKDIKSIQSTHVCITRRESCSYVVIQMEQSKISIGLMYSATGTCSHHRAVLN